MRDRVRYNTPKNMNMLNSPTFIRIFISLYPHNGL